MGPAHPRPLTRNDPALPGRDERMGTMSRLSCPTKRKDRIMALPRLATTVVGSYPQPDWLVDRSLLAKGVPRVRQPDIWRVAEPFLEQAQDDATILAIHELEQAGIDVITDGEIRRESYSNRFATALEGVDVDNPGVIRDRNGNETRVPRVVGRIVRTRPVELRDM